MADPSWLGRQGIALALHSAADVFRTKDLPVVMTFLISRALKKWEKKKREKRERYLLFPGSLCDPLLAGDSLPVGFLLRSGRRGEKGEGNFSWENEATPRLPAGERGDASSSCVGTRRHPVFPRENEATPCLSADPNVDVRTRMINAGIRIIDKHGKENVLLLFPIFDSYLNKKPNNLYFKQDDPKVHTVVEKLLDVLNTPSEAVQRAVSDCLSPLMASKQYGERRGAAFGLAGVAKGFKISSLKKYGIVAALHEGLQDRYVIQMLPLLLVSFSDQVLAVREAAECAARAMMSRLTGYGVKLILPSLLKVLACLVICRPNK
ncbi:hypothetical protein GW17_00003263 [Ensete ventricosum]|nr:hypothetical protein GW17_00003263 [Ensete ventricosum]